MPKRLCPFDNNLMPQIKTHVTEKEYNSSTGKGMNNVYDKTTSMLFNGVKKLYDVKIKPTTGSDHSKSAKENKETLCIVCKYVSKDISKCWYCDKELCINCLGVCIKCKEFHCRNCSIVSYEDQLCGLVCLSCYNN